MVVVFSLKMYRVYEQLITRLRLLRWCSDCKCDCWACGLSSLAQPKCYWAFLLDNSYWQPWVRDGEGKHSLPLPFFLQHSPASRAWKKRCPRRYVKARQKPTSSLNSDTKLDYQSPCRRRIVFHRVSKSCQHTLNQLSASATGTVQTRYRVPGNWGN